MSKTDKAECGTGIKGFNKDLTCRGFQFEEGKTYTHDGAISACNSGFHCCPVDHHPLSVFHYYRPGISKYHEVEFSGRTDREGNKVASSSITIGIELSIDELVKRAVDFVFANATGLKASHTKEDWSAASAAGDWSAASVTGNQSVASAAGDWSAASATGNQSAASATGNQSAASVTGNQSVASAAGDWSAASAAGDQNAASVTGNQSAAMACGRDGRVMGKDGNALFAVERDREWNILSVACGIVGREGIVAEKWYICRGGKLVEVA